MSATDKLWTITDIANYIQKKPRHVRDKLVKIPSFPRPILLPSASERSRRWYPDEVISWIDRFKISRAS
jgi:predicted DNA-binding transcriptional regulator AlpA